MTRWPSRSLWVVEEWTNHLYLQPSWARREDDLNGIVAHWIAIPGVLDHKLHFFNGAERRRRKIRIIISHETDVSAARNDELTELRSKAGHG